MTAQRRLLDMLAGWAALLEDCIESYREDPTKHAGVSPGEYEAEQRLVTDLYQDVGEIGVFDNVSAEYVLRRVSLIVRG